jgi:hypothetical protein
MMWERNMGHTIAWDNADQTVILQTYTDPVTKDDLYELVKKSAQMINACDHPVHVIIDERRINFVLNSADLSYIQRMLPANQGMVVVVVLPGNMAYKLVAQERIKQIISKDTPYFVDSLEAARAILQQTYGTYDTQYDDAV